MDLKLLQLNDYRAVGRLTGDSRLKTLEGGKQVLNFDIAVNRRYEDAKGEWKDDVTFVPVVVWNGVAAQLAEKLKKGVPVYVEGRLKSRAWIEEGTQTKRTALEVQAFRTQIIAKLNAADTTDVPETAETHSEAPAEAPAAEPV